MGVGIAGVASATQAFAQDMYYIVHKPTNSKMQVCAGDNGKPVTSRPNSNTGDCVKFELVAMGDYFQIKSLHADKILKPDTNANASPISIQPSTWSGNWTQWSYDDRGDGYGHIVNRGTGKQIFLSAKSRANIEQQPASWKGDFTRWAFVPVDGVVVTPTPNPGTPTPTITPTVTPTPTPTQDPTSGPTPGSTTVESESGVLEGNAEAYDDAGASGGQGVAYVFEIGDGISYTNVQAADSISINYASENVNGKLSVSVNGADVGDISFGGTGSWGAPYSQASMNVSVPSNSTVRIFFDEGDSAMNMDTITFTLSGPTPTPSPSITPDPNVTASPTPTPSATPNACDKPVDVDPVADFGDGMTVGLTTDGIAYHREANGATRGFAVFGLTGNGDAQLVTHTTQSGESYPRYESQISVSPGGSYELEMRLQGNEFPGGQCIQSWTFAPGESATSSNCYTSAGTGEPVAPPAPPSATSTRVTNGVTGEARLVGGPGSEMPGFALYTFDDDVPARGNQPAVSNCSGGCEDNWPKVIVANADDSIAAGGVTGEFGTIPRVRTVTDSCGNSSEVTDYHVTYEGRPLYFFASDTSAGTTAGANIPKWDLAVASLIPQLPLVDHPAPALKSTINGITPRRYGFAIDIEGRRITWRPGANGNNSDGLISQFSPWGGDYQPRSAKDPDLQFYCSNNQIQFHMVKVPGTLAGPYTTEIPAACYGKFYYFYRYRMYGNWGDDPDHNFVYTALFEYDETNPDDRIDPSKRPTVTYEGANWQRFRHPHARDGLQEAVFDATHNNSELRGLERYATEIVDGPGYMHINPKASIAPMRLEILEWGAGVCEGPQYIIGAENAPFPIRPDEFNYGQILTWEATFGRADNRFPGGGSIGSQVYNTYQHNTVGQGFTTSTGDPRLNPAGRASVYLAYSPCNPSLRDDQDAVFTQHLTSVTSASVVNDFILGHHLFHGVSDAYGARAGSTGFAGGKEIKDTSGNTITGEGAGSCGSCHLRDGRSSFVIDTAKGPRIAPPTYGTGLLEWIEGAEVGLTWDGSTPTVREQAEKALADDHGLTPAAIGADAFDKIVTYTEVLHVPVREYSAYRDEDVAAGEVAFHEQGCADCHQPTQKTSSDAPVWARDLYIRPYTDMKLHNVGTGGTFRTPPLWGIGRNIELLERNNQDTLFLHDGRAGSLQDAISAHADAGSDMEKIVKFLKTL